MEKIIARYFYSPICSEAFASLDRLSNLFHKYQKDILFQTFNVFNYDFRSEPFWFPREKELIDSIMGNGDYVFLYGELFIQGKKIKGFPPSKGMISEILKDNGVPFQEDDYQFDYGSANRGSFECDIDGFHLRKYDEKNLKDSCIICTKHNPFLKEEIYIPETWAKYENLKVDFLKENLDKEDLIGCIEYYGDEPVGFIEGFTLDKSRRLGFPISNSSSNGIVITCISVRKEVSGYGVASRLIESMEREARNRKYESIEVLSFPDKHNWQPESLYRKKGYRKVRKISEYSIMKKVL